MLTAVSLQFVLLNTDPDKLSQQDTLINFAIFTSAVFVVFVFYGILKKNQNLLLNNHMCLQKNGKNLANFNSKFSNLTDGLQLKFYKSNLFFIPVFLMRRVFYAVLASFLVRFPYF